MRSNELIGVVVGALLALCALATTAPAASTKFSDAVGGKIVLTSANLATWDIRNDTGTNPGTPTGECSSGQPGLSVHDAVLNTVNRGDAFDGAFALWVNDQRFVAPDTVDVTDQRLTAGPVQLAGLQVTVEYRALQFAPLLRVLVTIENPTDVPFAGTFVLGSNFGSDGATAERGRGDPSQNWFVTSDSATAPSDPVILMATGGPEPFGSSGLFTILGRLSTDDTTFSCGGTAGRETTAPLFVPARQTIRLLEFVFLGSLNAEAVSVGGTFDENPPLDGDLMAGIAAEQSLSIVNWSFFDSTTLTGGGASWFFSGLNGTSNALPVGGECGAIPGIGMLDARIDAPVQRDAFDRALLVFVDDVPLPPTTPVSEDFGSLRVGPVTFSGLELMLTHTALQSSPTLRTLLQVSNPTAAAVSTKIAVATNFGSDTDTVVRSTSDGDGAITGADRWAITSDDLPPADADPVSTHVVAGPGTPPVLPVLGTDVFKCSGATTANGLLATYELSVGPGETQTLLLFNQLHAQVETATADVAAFDEPPQASDALLENLDATILTTVVNWSLCRRTTYPDALCRVGGLQRDAFAAAPAGPVGDKMLARVGAAGSAIEDAEGILGRRRLEKKLLKKAQASLKAFEKLLKSKKARAVVAEDTRVRLTATSAEIRTTAKALAALAVDGG